MQAYSQEFARIYNEKWAAFAGQIAPFLMGFYSSTPIGKSNRSVLDLCCGAGHLAALLLEQGYHVTGVDLSEHMLQYAKKNAEQYINSGQCRFIRADASDFTLDERFGLVVSTYDSLNHLPDEDALFRCFRCVRAVCDGYFIFDLNTRAGLQRWETTMVDDTDENVLLIRRGRYDNEKGKALMTFTGFERSTDGKYTRFDESVFNTAFDLARVQQMLYEVGWSHVHFARGKKLVEPITEPESEGRVFIIASQES